MKLKSILPVIFIILLSAIAFTACDAEDEPQFSENSINESQYSETIINMPNEINIQLDSLFIQSLDSIHLDSISPQIDIVGTTDIKYTYSNGYYFCRVSFRGVNLIYETKEANLFPPRYGEEHATITYDTSGYGDTRIYDITYREIDRSQNYCMIRITIGVEKNYLGLRSKTFTVSLGLTFDRSQKAIVNYWNETENS